MKLILTFDIDFESSSFLTHTIVHYTTVESTMIGLDVLYPEKRSQRSNLFATIAFVRHLVVSIYLYQWFLSGFLYPMIYWRGICLRNTRYLNIMSRLNGIFLVRSDDSWWWFNFGLWKRKKEGGRSIPMGERVKMRDIMVRIVIVWKAISSLLCLFEFN